MQPSESRFDPLTAELLRRLTMPSDAIRLGSVDRLDLSQIDPLALGDLWAAVHSVDLRANEGPVASLAADTARELLALGRMREPAFRGPACRDVLDQFARRAERESTGSGPRFTSLWSDVCSCLARCTDLSFTGLGSTARRLLALTGWWRSPHVALALARLAGSDAVATVMTKLASEWSGSSLLLGELRVAADLDVSLHVSLARAADRASGTAPGRDQRPALRDEAAYVSFAASGLAAAARRMRDIHAGAVPYEADRAFTLADSAVVARLARVGLSRDEPWVPAVLDEVFRKAAVAPTSAKTVPSQSVAIGLGHTVEACPTPEAVATLRAVVRLTRHAGIKKKLDRNLRCAERNLAHRPEPAARRGIGPWLAASTPKALIRCLEASFASGLILNQDDWRAWTADARVARPVAARLVWRLRDAADASISVLPTQQDGGLVFADVNGAIVMLGSECRMILWHPADVSAGERTAWRDRITLLQIKQPFAQIFREHYDVSPSEREGNQTTLFAGHLVAGMPFVGVARKEGWRLHEAHIERAFGRWVAKLALTDDVYPGYAGGSTTRDLSFWTVVAGALSPVRFDDMPKVALSEILRAIDLLVSVGGVAVQEVHDDHRRNARLDQLARQSGSGIADMRRLAIQCALRGREGMADVAFGARHLHLGPYAIHLATGRVTRDGDPIAVEGPKHSNLHAVPWLPYDEKLLELIVFRAVEVAAMQTAASIAAADGPHP